MGSKLPSFFNKTKGVHDCYRENIHIVGSKNKGKERSGERPSWIIKDWPRLKSAMVEQAKLICNMLLMEADTSTRIRDSLRILRTKEVRSWAWPLCQHLWLRW